MKKLIALTMTLTFVLSCIFSSYAFAAQPENVEPYASNYFNIYSVKLTDKGDGKISIDYTVQSKSIMDKLGIKKIELEKESNSTWETIKTYTNSTYPSLIIQNTAKITGSLTYSGSTGSTYRAKATFYAKNSSGSDTKNFTSSSITV